MQLFFCGSLNGSPKRDQRPRRQRQAERGGVLIEAMLGMVVAGFVTLSGMSLMMTTASASDGARQTALAYAAAREQIENVRSLRAAKMANGTYTNLLNPATQMAQLNNGSGTLSVSDYRAPVKQVTVTIRWRAGGAARARSLSLTTLIAPGGVTP